MTYANANAGEAIAADFKLVKVVSKSFGIFRKNIILLAALSFVAVLPLSAIFLAIIYGGIASDPWIYFAIATSLTIFLMPFVTAIILHIVIQQIRGRTARPAEVIPQGFLGALVFWGIAALHGQGVMSQSVSTTVLLVVTSLVLMVLWCIAMPLYVGEKAGPYQSLRRGIALTKGFRWKILILYLLCRALNTVGNGAFAFVPLADNVWVQAIFKIVWHGLSVGFGAVLMAVAYYSLRVAKEGVDVERIGTVFD